MNTYEIMVIIDSDLSAEDAQKHIKEAVLKPIADAGGKVTFEDFWGERGFAYKINGKKWGYYFVAQFNVDGEFTLVLRKALNIDTKVVRSLITLVDKKAPAPRKYADVKKEAEALARDKKIREAEATQSKQSGNSAPKSSPKDETKATTEAPKKDAVDKKLDSIVSDATANL